MIRVRPTRHRVAWTEIDDAELRQRCDRGEVLRDIALALDRTQEACRTRANKLGIPCRSS